MSDVTLTGPVSEHERIAELDVLRGIALFGVLTVNFIVIAGPGVMATEAQLAALPTATLDNWTYQFVRIFMSDKANTVFATLFGLGFYIQLSRSEGRPGFEARYRRRLAWLLVFGLLNMYLLWVWDILNLYAVAGFILLFMRRWKTRSLLIFGIAAALYSDKLQEWLIGALNLPIPNSDSYFSDAAILNRQALMAEGNYLDLVAYYADFTTIDWFLSGLMVGLLVYALGRFAIGAAIGRSGIFAPVRDHLPLFRRVARIALPLGLAANALLWSVVNGWGIELSDGWKTFGEIMRSPAALLLAAGYCAGVVVALQRDWGRKLFGTFAPVGQMALTNYLAQGLAYGFILSGVGPGLALAGNVGSFAILMICVAFFALQIAFSHWWLARYSFGPMEWLWRTLTYGERPAMRRLETAPAAA